MSEIKINNVYGELLHTSRRRSFNTYSKLSIAGFAGIHIETWIKLSDYARH